MSESWGGKSEEECAWSGGRIIIQIIVKLSEMGACASSKPTNRSRQDLDSAKERQANMGHQLILEERWQEEQIQNQNQGQESGAVAAPSPRNELKSAEELSLDNLHVNEENEQNVVVGKDKGDGGNLPENQVHKHEEETQSKKQAIDDLYDANDEDVQKPLETANFINTGMYLMRHRNLNDVEILHRQKSDRPIHPGSENRAQQARQL